MSKITVEEAERRFAASKTHEEIADALHWAQRHRRTLLEPLGYGRLDPNGNRMRIVRAMNASRDRVNKAAALVKDVVAEANEICAAARAAKQGT